MSDKLLAWSAGGFCAFLGILLAGIGGLLWQNEIEFQGRALSTKGKVVSLISFRSSSSRGYVYRPVVRYSLPNGTTSEMESSAASNPPRFQVGDEVEVLYDPHNLTDVRLKADLQLPIFQIVFIGMGSIFVLIGGGIIVTEFYGNS